MSMRAMASPAFLLAVLISSCSAPRVAAPDGPAVGLQRFNWSDPTRTAWGRSTPRPLVTTVWYPAAGGARMTQVGIPPDRPVFVGGWAARGAPIRPTAVGYPLVVMSHGTGGSAMQMMWLGRALAERGYVAAAVDHHGNSAAEDGFDPRGFRMPWERAIDLSRMTDLLLEDETFGPSINANEVSAIGFSLGGYTVTALAGARTDLAQLRAFCAGPDQDATCHPQPEFPEAEAEFDALLEGDPVLATRLHESSADLRDPRIGKVVALAPALGQAFTRDSLARITVPMLFVVGTADVLAPPATNARHLADAIPRARLELLSGAGHHTFLSTCNARGRKYVPVCADPEGIERSDVHAAAIARVLDFLR